MRPPPPPPGFRRAGTCPSRPQGGQTRARRISGIQDGCRIVKRTANQGPGGQSLSRASCPPGCVFLGRPYSETRVWGGGLLRPSQVSVRGAALTRAQASCLPFSRSLTLSLSLFFLAMPEACGGSWAGDQTRTPAVTTLSLTPCATREPLSRSSLISSLRLSVNSLSLLLTHTGRF